MTNMLTTRKLKSKKGFTLIELIVVIAILGILAVIAVPRFAGFTNKAKLANDDQLATIAQHAIQVLVASGDIVPTVATTIVITKGATDLVYTPETDELDDKDGTALVAGTLTGLLEPMVGTGKLFSPLTTDATISIALDGTVSDTIAYTGSGR